MTDFLTGLSATTAELPKSEGGRGRKVKDNPFTAWVRDSYADGNGRQVEVPGANAKEAAYLIRQAAGDLGLGVRVVALNSKGVKLDAKTIADMAEKGSTAKVRILFQGKEKRAYERRQGTTATGTTSAE
ncbi:hypothetical protein SEA_FORTHEBOIS_8 [Streptomyces phage Forthebois]|uniref:Uncharacterized protein n=1 Tax=Streptomyces phage Forthebois TaxID=2562185 RepID=A0A4D6E2D7_9VIRU|nr:hypothetical protein KMD60_gp36 [Streptomyces phage Forthebois]QBZ72840.1 hypothetical protein SEA_FORTHEBOIS_8 [Streptomyces phage Forthebois]